MIFDSHPELKKDVISMSYLKDPILLSNLQDPDTVRNIAYHHRVLIDASETIVKCLKTAKNTVETSQIPAQAHLDDLSDSSSSSSSDGNSPQASGSNIARRITTEHFTQALLQAQGRNSLANISQRNLRQSEGSTTVSPSTSSASVPAGPRLISSSMLMNAMNSVLRTRAAPAPTPAVEATTPQTTQESTPEPMQEVSAPTPINEEINMDEDEDAIMIAGFQTQLREMENMGLTNKTANIQALIVCDGNLEAAVNYVLSEMNSMN